jgi:hypothetical protein
MTDAERTYLYALVRPADVRIEAPGIMSRPTRVVAVETFGAVVSSVPEDLFAADSIESRMSDAGWVTTIARAHDDVVAAATHVATTIPLRLGTTSDNDDSVRALLSDLAMAATRTFDRFEGRTEYGVQVFAPRPRSGATGAEREGGAAFLRRRRAELQQDEALRAAAAEEADTAFELLTRAAVDARRIRVRDRTPETTGPMVLNGAFLVDTGAVASFREVADQLAASLGPDRVVITGPWAPYTFAELDL